MSDVVGRVSGSAISAVIGVLTDGRRRRNDDRRAQRRTAADDLLSWIPELRERLWLLQSECDLSAWRTVMSAAFASCLRVDEITPGGWGHLTHSLRDSIGNGAGSVMWIDISPQSVHDDLAYNNRWTGNAAEYLEYVQSRVQRWRAAFSEREARRVRLLSYNNWLIRTNRVWDNAA
ncbi:MAG: hypothetical protein JWQ39_2158 [Glaciihabitans sp.]|nr:hypothetical protein [Glaciihabitans sp.]